MMDAGDPTKQWPPNFADKRHWCLAYDHCAENGRNYYCDDPQDGKTGLDSQPDYSVFSCNKSACQTCLNLNPAHFPARQLYPGSQYEKKNPRSQEIHFTWKALEESASKGCETCSVIEEGIRSARGLTGIKTEIAEVYCLEILQGFTVRVTQEKKDSERSKKEDRLAIEFYSHAGKSVPVNVVDFAIKKNSGKPTPWSVLGIGGTVTSHIGVADCVAFIKSRMEKCLEHPCCIPAQPAVLPKLPTRLIDIGNTRDEIRLEENPKAGEAYIALSHCWGPLASLPTTTSSNLLQQCENIPWSTLTKTFQDAVLVTRELGIRYLWIDSLCIIQDSLPDWEFEAKDMANIYTNSHLTLGATSASEHPGGLLKFRYNKLEDGSSERAHEIQIKRKSKDGLSEYTVYARRPIKSSHEFLLSFNYKVSHLKAAPLLCRAWGFQERLLSPRVLHFSFDELVWECKAGIDCECGYSVSPSGTTESSGPIGRDIFKELLSKNEPHSFPNLATKEILNLAVQENHREELVMAWYRLVEYYMTLLLTFPSDRLPAFHGVASYLEGKFNWTYFEGVWIEDFVRSVSWQRNWMRPCRRNKAAPSWSWASLEAVEEIFDDTEISKEMFNKVQFAYDENSKLSWKPDERFQILHSSANSALATMEAYMFAPPYQDMLLAKKPFLVVKAASVNGKIVCEPLHSNDSSSTVALRLSIEGNDNLFAVSWDIDPEESYAEVAEGDEIYCIALVHYNSSLHGLALRRDGSGFYQRVGIFAASDEDNISFQLASEEAILV
jgi:hypothetical protein